MEVKVLNIQGKETAKKVVLADTIYGIEPNDHAIYLDVKQFLANQRQGTHKAKERGEVEGSTRKLHRQKGTGGARKGSIRNPLYKGGGRVFGPKPRDYSFKLNKKYLAINMSGIQCLKLLKYLSIFNSIKEVFLISKN